MFCLLEKHIREEVLKQNVHNKQYLSIWSLPINMLNICLRILFNVTQTFFNSVRGKKNTVSSKKNQ